MALRGFLCHISLFPANQFTNCEREKKRAEEYSVPGFTLIHREEHHATEHLQLQDYENLLSAYI